MIEGLSSHTIKAIDHFTINEIGMPSMVLMERAALAIVEELLKGETKETLTYDIVCGIGNNGGDGIAVGRLLHQAGKAVTIYLVGDTEHASDECRQQLTIADNLKMTIKAFALTSDSFNGDVVIDALFGIGLSRDVEDPYKQAIDCINKSKGKIAAIDVPSGLSADAGEVLGQAVKAEDTYTIGFMKKGFKKANAQTYTGNIKVLDIGYPADFILEKIINKEETHD